MNADHQPPILEPAQIVLLCGWVVVLLALWSYLSLPHVVI